MRPILIKIDVYTGEDVLYQLLSTQQWTRFTRGGSTIIDALPQASLRKASLIVLGSVSCHINDTKSRAALAQYINVDKFPKSGKFGL